MLPFWLALTFPSQPVHAHGNEVHHIVGGQPAAQGTWPEVAAIVYKNGSVECTGTLIAPDLVLTAAHCARRIAAVRLNTTDLAEGEEIAVTEVHTHPRWRTTYDVAVLELEHPTRVMPRAIAADCVAEALLVEGAPVAFAGWGAIDAWGQEYGDELVEGFSQLSDPFCEDLDLGCNPDISPGGELAARSEDGVDTCNGDSGGPLYVWTPEGEALLAGVTSRAAWSLGDDAGPDCAGEGLYVRADVVMPWIEAVTGRQLARPLCEAGWTPRLAPPPVGYEVRGGCDSSGGSSLAIWACTLLLLRRRR